MRDLLDARAVGLALVLIVLIGAAIAWGQGLPGSNGSSTLPTCPSGALPSQGGVVCAPAAPVPS